MRCTFPRVQLSFLRLNYRLGSGTRFPSGLRGFPRIALVRQGQGDVGRKPKNVQCECNDSNISTSLLFANF